MSSVILNQQEADEFLELIRVVEDIRGVSHRDRQMAVGKYMLCSGVNLTELKARFDAVCPLYLDRKAIWDYLHYTGRWVDRDRPRIYAEIFSSTWGGKVVDSKAMLNESLDAWSEACLRI